MFENVFLFRKNGPSRKTLSEKLTPARYSVQKYRKYNLKNAV